MIRKRPSYTPLEQFATYWQMLGFAAVAFARQLLMMERAGDHKTYLKARQLEAWLCGALGLMTKQISEQDGADISEADLPAAQYLKTVFCMLTALLYFSRALMRRVKGLDIKAHSTLERGNPTLYEPYAAPQRYAYCDSG